MLLCFNGIAKADGFFVQKKFVWDKQRDIHEPAQKAILVHRGDRQDLLLQVKYAGPMEDFGWVIPVPSVPAVTKGSMDCFYELSRHTQRQFPTASNFRSLAASADAAGVEPPMKVIETKTVGAYDVAILSSRDVSALETWLRDHEFSLPPESSPVIEHYVRQQWYFIAAKINARSDAQVQSAMKLANGELHPLLISFKTDRCVFPLKISSLNNTPSEVQLYVLSPQALLERQRFEESLDQHGAWRRKSIDENERRMRELRTSAAARALGRAALSYPMRQAELGDRSMVNKSELIQFSQPAPRDMEECRRTLPLLKSGRDWWLTKVTWTFKPEEMRDLTFVPAAPLFSRSLAHDEGAFAAANLMNLGAEGAAAIVDALQHANGSVRARALAAASAPANYPQKSRDGAIEELQAIRLRPEVAALLPKLLTDSEPEVRLHAMNAAMEVDGRYLADALRLLRDPHAEVAEAAISYVTQQARHLPEKASLFRQLLADTNENVQIAGLRSLMILGADIPRADLIALFKRPRLELAGAAFAQLKQGGVSCDEARPLLESSEPMLRLMGMAALIMNANRQSVELALPMLNDAEETIRTRAHNLLTDLTGQSFPIGEVRRWEAWWQENKATFEVTVSQEELRRKASARARERRRNLLLDNPLEN